MSPKLYVIRGPDGKPEAIHQRIEQRDGKTFVWWSRGPDGQPTDSLEGRRVESLPLFGSQHVAKWDTSRPVFIVEGEKATMALAAAGYRALGTLGSSITPSDASLAVLIGFDVALWTDADPPGHRHMLNIASAIQAAVRSLRWVEWPDAPLGSDAADYLAAGLKVEDLTLGPVPQREPALVIPIESPRRVQRRRDRSASPIERFNHAVPVSEVLRRDYRLEARPGRALRCPFHDDRHPSLSLLRDDRRAFCHVANCWANNNGRGRDAWDLAHGATGEVAK